MSVFKIYIEDNFHLIPFQILAQYVLKKQLSSSQL